MSDMKTKNSYVDLESLAYRLGLPKTYLFDLVAKGRLPYLDVNGKKRFDVSAVKGILDELVKKRRVGRE